MSQKKILVVEDEPLVGFQLKDNLENNGYIVPEVVETGESFGEAMFRCHPDLVLMDIRLKGNVDGIQAAEQAKSDFGVPVIYLTAYSDADTLERAAETEPEAFLLKPFDERELLANIQIALAKSRDSQVIRRELLGAMSLVDAMEDPALITDTKGRIAHVNASAIRALNLSDPSELARVPLSLILDAPVDEPGDSALGLKVNRRGSQAVVASMEKLLRFDGTEYGSLVVFGSMKKRESRFLENSASEANATLQSYLPGPASAGPGYRVAGFLECCLSGSGDFYDVFPAGNNRTAFYSLDVMGHGMIASLLAFSLHDIIPLLGRFSKGKVPSPAEVLCELYSRYRPRGTSRTMFFSITYGVIDNETGQYVVARGGHMPLIHLSVNGGAIIHNTQGMAVGVVEASDVEEAQGTLEPGDRFVLASDGVAEALGGDGSLDSALNRIRIFADSFRTVDIGVFVDAFRRQVKQNIADRITEDDMSLLVIERLR